MDGCLDNNIEHSAFARLGVHALVVASFDAEYNLECMADTDIGALVPVRKSNFAAFCRELQLMGERPRTWTHER